MVVDDDPDILELVKTLLEKNGYYVVTANNGEECLKKLHEEDIEIVLLDVIMPGMSGLEVFRRIMEKYKDVAVMLLTVVTTPKKEKEILFKEGLIDYILKPFDSRELINRIQLYLGEKKINVS